MSKFAPIDEIIKVIKLSKIKFKSYSESSNLIGYAIIKWHGQQYIVKKVKKYNKNIYMKLLLMKDIPAAKHGMFIYSKILKKDKSNTIIIEKFYDISLHKYLANIEAADTNAEAAADNIYSIVIKIIFALRSLAANSIIHNDLHLKNIMLNSANSPTIIDFDNSVLFPAKFSSFSNLISQHFPELYMKYKDRDDVTPNEFIFLLDPYVFFSNIVALLSGSKNTRIRHLCAILSDYIDEIGKNIDLIFADLAISQLTIDKYYNKIFTNIILNYEDICVKNKAMF